MIESAGGRFLTDPVLGAGIGPLRRHGPAVPEAWVAGADAVLVSHLHHDHLDRPSIGRFPRTTPILVPHGGASVVARLGFDEVIEVRVGDRIRIAESEVLVVPAAHRGRRAPFGPHAECVGYVVTAAHSVYFAGDTDLFDDMHGLVDDLDVALLPVWGWGPRLGRGHMDPAAAATAAARLRPRVAVPIHWGALSLLGTRRFNPRFLWHPPISFSAHVDRASPDVAVQVLEPGEVLLVDWKRRVAEVPLQRLNGCYNPAGES
jgi:L-ascorbate metabolism protein UlaG (beta-lactamase superfamily)